MRAANSCSQQGIQSIEVGNRLLLVLAEASAPMMLRDLASAAGMSSSKAHRYLVSYARVGLVHQEPRSGRYDLGPLSLQLGFAALRRFDAISLAMPMLRELGETLGQTVALAAWANCGATIVRWLGSDAPVTATLRVGSVMPLTRSATGLVFAAHMPRSRWLGLVKRELAENRRRRLKPRTLAELEPQARAHPAARLCGRQGFHTRNQRRGGPGRGRRRLDGTGDDCTRPQCELRSRRAAHSAGDRDPGGSPVRSIGWTD